MNETLTKSEEKLCIVKQEHATKLLPICEALKMAGFDIATIADLMHHLQQEEQLPAKFSIVNNRYLVHRPNLVYDLHNATVLDRQPDELKRMAIIFWI